MKKVDQSKRFENIFSTLILCILFVFTAHSQTKKHKVRLNASYVKVMDGEIFINLKTSSRINKQNQAISGAKIMVSNEVDNEEFPLGHVVTDANGEGTLTIAGISTLKMDSTATYNLRALFKGNDTLTKASRRIAVRDAKIIAKVYEKDSVNYISAQLIDSATDSLLEGQSLSTHVQRLIRPLQFGEDFNETDENGSISAKIPNDIPGIDGNLDLEVLLLESDDYGTVKAVINAPVGIPIVEESTFDKRTMWSPKSKTPIYLLIIGNFIIFAIWGTILLLIRNLFKISKA